MTKTQAETVIQKAIKADYNNFGEQQEGTAQAEKALAILTRPTDEQSKAVATLRDFVHQMTQGTPTNPQQIPNALEAIDTLSGEWSQESLRASLHDEMHDAITNVLETHDVNEILVQDKASEAIRSIITRIENRNIRLNPETF